MFKFFYQNRFGKGVTREIGLDLIEMGVKNVCVVTDPHLFGLKNGPVQTGEQKMTQTQTYTNTDVHKHTQTVTHKQSHTNNQTHTHTHTHTHTPREIKCIKYKIK